MSATAKTSADADVFNAKLAGDAKRARVPAASNKAAVPELNEPTKSTTLQPATGDLEAVLVGVTDEVAPSERAAVGVALAVGVVISEGVELGVCDDESLPVGTVPRVGVADGVTDGEDVCDAKHTSRRTACVPVSAT